MATAAEPVKEKKKNRLRSRFLAAQASSLDSVTPSSDAGEEGDLSRTMTTGSSPSSCSRMRRMLFRRTRSEAVVDVSRSPGINKSLSRANDGESFDGQSSVGWNQRGRLTVQEEPVPCHLMTPQSPPPPYDQQSDCGSVRSNSTVSPPSYAEAMLQDGIDDFRRQPPYCQWIGRQEPQMIAEPLSAYCTCRECQIRYASAEEEEHDDNCADAVFPMETHVLMQEVLADGMAFCSLM